MLANRLGQQLSARGKRATAHEVEDWVSRLGQMLAHDVWRNIGAFTHVPSNSQVLLKRHGYRDVTRFDLALKLGLQLSWSRANALAEGIHGDIRPVSELYEYWCFFVLRKALAEICETELPSNGSFVAMSDDGLRVWLQRGKRSRVTFRFRSVFARSLRVSLFYNRRFRRPNKSRADWSGSYTASFDPDYSILVAVEHSGKIQRHWLHFDAKYRIEFDEVDALFGPANPQIENGADNETDKLESEQEIERQHKRDDLFKMHTYRDGILGSRGAYILFPGSRSGVHLSGEHQNIFVRHPTAFDGRPAYPFPSVGAIALCPGRDDSQLAALKSFLNAVLQSFLSDTEYEEEAGYFGAGSAA